MSSDILKDISDEFLECQVCFRTYSRPKLLGCLHTFCEACLVDHVPEGTSDITCPVCSQTTPLPQDGVSKLKEDSFISNLVATVGAKKRVLERRGNIPCEGCDDKKNATSRCVVCNDFLCRSCVTAHPKMKVFRGHLVVSFDDMKKGLFDESPELKNGPTCDIHEGEKIRFFCKTCEIPVCHNCTVLDHSLPKHQISRLKATTEELRRDMLHHLNEATRHKSTLDRKSHDIERKKADFLKQNEDTCHRLEKKFEELTHTIDQLKEKALEMTKTKAAIKIKELDTMKEKVDSYRSRLSSGCTYAENILTRGSDAEVAAAFHQMRESLSEGVKCSRRTDQYDPDLTMVWADVYDMDLNRLLEEVREILWRDDDEIAEMVQHTEGTFKFTVQNFTSLQDTASSPTFFFNNFLMNLECEPEYSPDDEEGKNPFQTLGVFLGCKRYTQDSAWPCDASVDFRILPKKPGVDCHSVHMEHKFIEKDRPWGYPRFIAWKDVCDEESGYIRNDRVTFEVCVKVRNKGMDSNDSNFYKLLFA
ncbi:tripartite motif-containing protein 2-like [Branchiostoma floridae x Branchiostoma belcheri]